MAKPVYTLGVEFVAGSYTNLTSLCLQAQVERQLITLFESPRPGHAMFVLANEDARLSPQNSASPFYPNIVPGKQVKLEASYNQYALLLNPTSQQYVTVQKSLSNSLSVEIWARSTGSAWNTDGWMAASRTSGNGFIIHPSSGSTAVGFYAIDSAGAPSVVFTASPNNIRANHFYTLVIDDSAKKLYAYIDGAVQNSGGTSYVVARGVSSQSNVFFGKDEIAGRFGDGVIDAPRIYARALSASEVADHYAGVFNNETGLLGSWSFDEGSGQYVADTATSPNTGTLTNTPTFISSVMAPGGTTYAIFKGRTVNFTLDLDRANRTVLVEAEDSINRLANAYATTSLFTNTNAQSLFTALMSLSAVNSFAVDDTIRDTISFSWYEDEQIASAVGQLAEFGNYIGYEDGAGTFRLKHRNWRQGETSVATYTGSAGFHSFAVALSQESILNKIKISGQPRRQSTDVNTVAWLQEAVSIPGSSSTGFWLSYVDPAEPSVNAPAVNLVTPVRSSDWLLNESQSGDGTDRTATGSLQITLFGGAAVCSLFNGSPNLVYVTKFQIRGNSVQLRPELAAQSEDSSSQALYGKREFVLANNLLSNQEYVKNYADYLLTLRLNPQPDIRFELKNQFPDVLLREVGDVVSLIESLSAVNSQWQITTMTHNIALNTGLEHLVSYSVRYQPDYSWLVLDDATRGKLDDVNKLGF